jgi:peptidoglycan/LPS O-acetylase OafA/YrhL
MQVTPVTTTGHSQSDWSSKRDGAWVPELDGLRALACLSVVLVHFNPAPLQQSPALLNGLHDGLVRLSLANIGVVFFFTLSAFLLTYLAARESARPQGFSVSRFWLRRCARIWPLYFVVLAAALLQLRGSLPAQMSVWSWTVQKLWVFTFFVSNWSLAFNHVGGYVDHSTSALAILWSIGVEEQFYFLYPLLFLMASRSRRTAIVVIGTLALVALGCRIAFVFMPVEHLTPPSSGGMYYATTTYFDVFLAGAIAGWMAARAGGVSGHVKTAMTKKGVGLWLAGTCVAIFVAWETRWWHPYGWFTLVGYGVTGSVLALVLLWVWANPDARVCLFLRSGPMRTLGILSFGIYLWHPLVESFVLRRFEHAGGPLQHQESLSVIVWLLYLVGTIGMAAATYGLVEQPFLRLKSRLSNDSAPRRAPRLAARTWARVAVVAGVVLLSADVGLQQWLHTPTPDELTRVLGVKVDTAVAEVNQYLIRGEQGTAQLSKIGRIDSIAGASVGVTLPNGTQIGFRYEPLTTH